MHLLVRPQKSPCCLHILTVTRWTITHTHLSYLSPGVWHPTLIHINCAFQLTARRQRQEMTPGLKHGDVVEASTVIKAAAWRHHSSLISIPPTPLVVLPSFPTFLPFRTVRGWEIIVTGGHWKQKGRTHQGEAISLRTVPVVIATTVSPSPAALGTRKWQLLSLQRYNRNSAKCSGRWR